MDPNQQQPAGQAQYDATGYRINPPEQPGQPSFTPMSVNQPTQLKKSRVPLILIAIIGAVIFLGVGLGIGVAVSSKTSPKKATDLTESAQNQEPLPATEVGVTQTSNSISQDISANNEDKELPSTMLALITLGLLIQVSNAISMVVYLTKNKNLAVG